MTMRVLRKPEPRLLAVALRAWPAIPPLALTVPLLHHSDRLAGYGATVLGFDALLCLVGCVTITPLMTIMKSKAAKLRWWYGVWMFVLGAALLAVVLLTQMSDPAGAAAGDFTAWSGLAVVVLLVPMAVTANTLAQKLLGPEWKRWQRSLMWVVWGLTAVHLAALTAWPVLAAFLGATIPLIVFRWARGSVKRWRADGYSTGGWWLGLAVLGSMYLAGLAVLFTEQAQACAGAILGS